MKLQQNTTRSGFSESRARREITAEEAELDAEGAEKAGSLVSLGRVAAPGRYPLPPYVFLRAVRG
jgi:hypothetical protein